METGDIVELIILVILLALSGFFSSSETALTTVSLNKLRTIADEGGRRGKKAKLMPPNSAIIYAVFNQETLTSTRRNKK